MGKTIKTKNYAMYGNGYIEISLEDDKVEDSPITGRSVIRVPKNRIDDNIVNMAIKALKKQIEEYVALEEYELCSENVKRIKEFANLKLQLS